MAIHRHGEAATRIRPTPTVVNGQTQYDLVTNTADVRAVIALRSGDTKQQPWGQTAEGEHYAVVDPDDEYQFGDLLEAGEGVWEGERFRVTYVDRLTSTVALERVHAGNE